MKKKTVLIIDDEPDLIKITRMRLESVGYNVIDASNGKDGFERARSKGPDIILLDLVMPGEDGLETLSKLKLDPSTSAIPVIILTVKGESEYVLDAGKLGAAEYLTKPVEPEKLLETIEKYA